MKTYSQPRVVLVTRPSPLDELKERYGTKSQAKFFFATRQRSMDRQEDLDVQQEQGLHTVLESIPPDRRTVHIERVQLDRFQFAPDDIVVVVGQDGLVPNTAKYLDGQRVIGINPDPNTVDGVLCRHAPAAINRLIAWCERQDTNEFHIEPRVMAAAEREDGQRLLALNEVFVGHKSHQSARYRILWQGKEERQSSSGLIVTTGTGSTGWAKSIFLGRHTSGALPAPEERRLAWVVREPWPSRTTGTELASALDLLPDRTLEVLSEMGEGGVIFADGMEADFIEFNDGQTVRVTVAERALNLVVPRPGN